MALQTSGQISLNDAHVEVGGTSGTMVALNDTDIRGLIGKAAGAQFALSELYGASSVVGWIYVVVTPAESSSHNFGYLEINSNNDYFLVHEYTSKSSGRSTEGSNKNMELWKMSDEGVVSQRKGYSLDHISSTYHNYMDVSSGAHERYNTPKLILRGTTDLYHYYLRPSFQWRNQTYGSWSSNNVGFLVKNNQSDCNV